MVSHGVDRSGAAGGSGSSTHVIDEEMIAAKGDLFVGLAVDDVGILTVGTNDYLLVADSAATEGMKWSTGTVAFQSMVTTATVETAPAVGDIVMISDVSLTPDNGRSMTLENLWKVINGLTEKLLPIKTADYVSGYSAADSAARKIKVEELPLPRSYLAGGALSNNAGDATNDIDIAVGEGRDSTNAANIRWSALTKRLDAAWVAGTNQGGLDTGAIANTTYHLYAIRKDSDGTGDVLFSASASAPTMPSGYTYFRRVGSILREAAAIAAFSQNGDEFLRNVAVLDVDATNPGTAAVSRTLSVPVGVIVDAIVNWLTTNAAGAVENALYVSSLAISDQAASLTVAPLTNVTSAFNAAGGTARGQTQLRTRTNTSAQVRTRVTASDANSAVRGATIGWVDRRGRDA